MQERSRAERVAKLTPEQRAVFLARLGQTQKSDHLRFSWEFWGRQSQFPPPGDWSNWLILAGRGFGKTRTGAEWVRANTVPFRSVWALTELMIVGGERRLLMA